MSEKNEKNPNCAYELPAKEEPAPQRRAVPNIPRREPDSLPERPERSGSSGRSGTLILLILIVILLLLFFFWLRK